GKRIILPRKFELRVGEPVQVEHLGPKHGLPIRRQTTDLIMEKIAELTGQERVDAYNKRPDETASETSKKTNRPWLIQPHTGPNIRTFRPTLGYIVSKTPTDGSFPWAKPIISALA